MSNFYLAIDLGTTNTVVAVGGKNNSGEFKTEIITISQLNVMRMIEDKNYLPSVLFVDQDGSRLVGQIAKDMKLFQSGRTISNSKRFMGTSYKWEIDGQIIRPKDVAYEILKLCRNAAQKYLLRDVKEVVITVPASFNNDQIRDTIEAAVMAGFDRNKIEIIPEPTAALIDFINRESTKDNDFKVIDFSTNKRILVFDIGGGTCDISVVDVMQNGRNLKFKEIAVGRYEELGGIDFDLWAADYLLMKFLKENDILPETLTEEEVRDLTNKLVVFAEEAKERISSDVANKIMMGIEGNFDNISYSKGIIEFYKNKSYEFKITKKEYDEATRSLYYKSINKPRTNKEERQFKNIEDPIIETLREYNIPINSIDYVYMTGGMSRYIEVQNRVKEILGKPIVISPYPMESVARGAAVYHYYNVESTKLNSLPNSYISDVKMVETHTSYDIINVLAEAVMIDVSNGLPEVIIPAEHPVPFEGALRGKLKTTSPSGIKINIYGGKSPYDSRMRIQKSYKTKFRYPVQTGTPIDIEYKIDKNKILSLSIIIRDSLNQRIDLSIESDIEFEERGLGNGYNKTI
ncbi:Hsp70 family protein [Caloramator australicus]|uniref:Chaperone protein DnaK n=1 Tax=Caloramator australicus RC3 TaxID=857293 RepID=I7LK12_9CLOT|nr:Hsp70 family protein [Caloramator australicus]CCJ34128.1 Chaperone protein DnaK [Caloramator australicus RC3]